MTSGKAANMPHAYHVHTGKYISITLQYVQAFGKMLILNFSTATWTPHVSKIFNAYVWRVWIVKSSTIQLDELGHNLQIILLAFYSWAVFEASGSGCRVPTLKAANQMDAWNRHIATTKAHLLQRGPSVEVGWGLENQWTNNMSFVLKTCLESWFYLSHACLIIYAFVLHRCKFNEQESQHFHPFSMITFI